MEIVYSKVSLRVRLSFISQLRYDNEEFILPTPSSFRSIDFKASGENKQVMLGLPLRNSLDLLVDVVGSCNGLLLLCVDNRKDGLCIWNPWTQRYKMVSSETNVPRVTNLYLYLRGYGFGFGYDHSTDNYII
ncbi:hypothetical protein Dsin_028034 [Dipteronia sinensis]|uniref:F-box associated beta-propeller type 1 domain-containing protein n=1 Tax=Dipteronia sinensis TaxID=43782 RepID=A0AAD9ZPL2_9ROSI|nr:hypothetical protein Dsin_028034 [Dipteronia sinensis]